jgi:predicted RNase H-like HicB family nuclease
LTVLEYHAAYYRDEESGWYVAEVLDFPGVVSQGRTLNSARRMIRDALRGMADWYMEDGLAFPKPNARARDKKAVFAEAVRLRAQVQAKAKT